MQTPALALTLYPNDYIRRGQKTTQHLHGGIGSDLEFPIHRFFLWAKHLGMMLGGRSVQITKLGELLASDETLGITALQV